MFLILPLFALATNSYSQSQRLSQGFIEAVISLNQDASNLKGQEIYCRTGPIDQKLGPEFPEHIDRCMKDLCGNPQQNPTTTLTDHNIHQFVLPDADKNMESMNKAIQAAVLTEVDSNYDYISAARKLMVKNNLQVNPNDMSAKNWQNILHNVYGPFIQMYQDQAAHRDKRFKVSIDRSVQNDIKEEHLTFLNDFVSQLKNHVNQGPWFVKIKYLSVSLTEAKSLLMENYQTMQAQMKESLDNDSIFSLGTFFESHEEKQMDRIEQAIENLDNLSLKEIQIVTQDLIEVHAEVTENSANLQVNFCQTGPCREGVQTYLDQMDVENTINTIESQNNPLRAASIMDQCRFKVLADNIITPDPRAIKEAFPEVLKNFNDNVLTNYSAHSRAAFNQIAQDELEINAIKTETSNIQNNLTQSFEELASNNEFLNDQRKSLSSSDVVSWLFQKNIGSKVNYEEGINWQMDAFSNINPCQGQRPDLGGDMFRVNKPEEGKSPYEIMVSPHTCSHLGSGKGTLAHEMGHFLSRLFLDGRLSQESYQSYTQLRSCSSMAYKGIEPMMQVPGVHPYDTQKTEEDAADLIGILAMRTQGQEPTPASCALLIPNQYNTGYDHRSLINLAGRHSEAPLRVLTEAIHQSRILSPACRELIMANKDHVRFGKCF